jgi:signal transduction histidine kinase
MLKNLFSRLLITYLAILVLIVLLISVIISVIISNSIFSMKESELQKAAVRTNTIVSRYASGEINKTDLESRLTSLGFVSDSTIYVLKADKESIKGNNIFNNNGEIDESYIIDDLGDILKGNMIIRNSQYSNQFGLYVVYMGLPLVVNEKICGGIFLLSPVNEVYNTVVNSLITVWICSFIVIIFGSIIIYINSKRISRPVKEMEEAVKMIAEGETVEDINIKSAIEIEGLAKSFNYMKNQLEITEKVRKEFISNVSHDLRTPLTTIKGFLQAMMDGLIKPDEFDKYHKIIMDEVQRLYRLTNDILELAKLQSGNIKLIKENVNIKCMFLKIINSFELMAAEKNLKMSIICDEKLCIYADIDRLSQIFTNLVGNSVKYTNINGSIRVSAQKEDELVKFTVIDNGIGISKEDINYIFDKFYRAHGSGHEKNSSGIGLNIVKTLVELHGGKINAESIKGQGTKISIWLPT